jgi:hypothetical protein
LDYFSKNVPLIKFSGEKSKVLTPMLPLNSCIPTQLIFGEKPLQRPFGKALERFFGGGAIATAASGF